MVRMCSTYVLYICRAHRAAPPGVKGLSVRHARKAHPRRRGVLGIQAPPPSAPAIIQSYTYMAHMRSTYVLCICCAHRAALLGIIKCLSVRLARKVNPRPRGVLGIRARRWLLAPAEVPIIACNAGINKPTSPRQTAAALLWTWIGVLLR